MRNAGVAFGVETVRCSDMNSFLVFERWASVRGAEPDVTLARYGCRSSLALLLGALVLFGLAFRAAGVGVEGFGEDELNKLQAVEDYRAHGLTSANGEHPMLMKALLTLSLASADFWNSLAPATARPDTLRVSPETALRFPSALFGALTSVLVYLLAAELFGS